MAQAVDLGGLDVEAARLVNQDVNPARCLDQPARGAGVAAVNEPAAVPLDDASHRAAVDRLVIDQKHRQPRVPPKLQGLSISGFDPTELVTEQPGHCSGDRAKQLLDAGKNAPLGVHARLVVRSAPLLPQRRYDAPEQEGFEPSHVVRVLMTHKDVADLGRLASGSNEQPDDIQPAPRVEEDPASSPSLAPRDEQTCLMPRLVRCPAGSQQSNTHPRPHHLLLGNAMPQRPSEMAFQEITSNAATHRLAPVAAPRM